MILQKEIVKNSKEFAVPPSTIDKDWMLGHVLNAFYSTDEVKNNFVFKGGTCLRKCYFENYRFSEDLDFTLLDKNFLVDSSFIKKVLKLTEKVSGILFEPTPQIKDQVFNNVPQGYEIKVRFWGADHKPNQKPIPVNRWLTSLKIDISYSEKLNRQPILRNLIHPYTDREDLGSDILCYSLKEIVAEKLRSLIQRNRPRDIYDNWCFSNTIEHADYHDIKAILLEKAAQKSVDISKTENFTNSQKQNANKRAWENSLKHQITSGNLPDFDDVYNAIQIFVEKILNS